MEQIYMELTMTFEEKILLWGLCLGAKLSSGFIKESKHTCENSKNGGLGHTKSNIVYKKT
jgi:hypothetical protein